jgi:5'-nucleotidase
VLNVNMPGDGTSAYQWTTLGRRLYGDDVEERRDPRGRPYYWVGGGPTGHDDVDGTDCVAVARGWNSITPMHLDLTDRERIARPPWALEGFTVVVGSEPTR